jgi:hypothetical protein
MRVFAHMSEMLPPRWTAMAIATFASMIIVGSATAYFVWLTIFDPINPITEVRDSKIENPGGLVHRDEGLIISRTICSSRNIWLRIDAEFLSPPMIALNRPPNDEFTANTNPSGGGEMRHGMVPAWAHIEKGCHHRRRIWGVPAHLPPGIYRYTSEATVCNAVSRCVTVELPSPGQFRITDAPRPVPPQ